jgi:PEGA domain
MTVVSRSLVALLAIAGVAAAQPSSQAAAQAQFDKAVQLKKANNWKDACVAFEQSQKLDPQFGTLYNVAECNEHIGKLATAWAAYRELEQRDTNAGRRDHSRDLARALEPRLSKLMLTMSPPVAGATVTMNGTDATNLIGIETPVDIGSYELAADAPGHAHWKSTVSVTDEGKTVAVAITLQPSNEPVATTPAPVTAPAPIQPAVTATTETPETSHRTTYAIGATAVGGALVIGGLVVGELARGKWNDAKALCPDSTCASSSDLASANSLADAARTRGTVSDVMIGVGVAAAAVGVYLFLTPHHESATAMRVVPAGTGFALIGGF